MTLSTPPSRSRRSAAGGSSNGTPAAAIVFLPRVMRACTVGTGTRNARAICSLDRPPTTRRVSATRASGESTGWQLTNISARTSSSISSGSISSSTAGSAASRAYRSWRAVRRRIASIARRRPVAISQPAGLAGEASGHDTSASATASWAASSASPKSPVNRVSAATIRADSIRQTASTSAASIRSGRCSRARPSPLRSLVDLRDLVAPGHPPDLDLGPGGRRDPLGPLDRLLLGGDVEQEIAPEEFLGLAVRPVRDHRGLAAEVDHDALARIVQTFGGEENTGLEHLLDELARRGYRLVDRSHHGRVRLVGAPHDQHVLGHRVLLIRRGRLSTLAPTRRTSSPRIDTAPGEISRRDAADPPGPRFAR